MHKILDENYLDLLIENSFASVLQKEYDLTRINARYSVLHSPASRFSMCGLGNYPYHIFPTLYTLNSTVSLEKSNVITIQSNVNLSLFGEGVVIGFVDTGIDYLHEAFLNTDGSTKIFSIWDQTIETDAPPEGFTFGAEYDKNMINMALAAEYPFSIVPSNDENGHGTMLAGIAAGSQNPAVGFKGVAPQSELIVVKLAPAKRLNKKIHSIRESALCYPETNIFLGIEYILSVIQRIERPLVLCIGIGSSQSAHDGQSALGMYLNALSTMPTIAVCVSAGNEGSAQRHYRGTIVGAQPSQNIEFIISEKDPQFPLEIWQKSPSRLSVELISPSGEHIHSILPGFNICREHTFVFETSKVYINNFIMEEETGEQLILIRFENALAGIWKLRVTSIDNITSLFDAWMPSGDIISSETFFLESDPNVTITSPGNSTNPVTVTAYNQLQNSILLTSSHGFSSTNIVKPEIAAPGYALTCPLPGQNYGTGTGTGAASAHAAGIIALFMEWAVWKGNYTTITGRDISRLLIRGARRDKNITYPNPVWGYGQIDIQGLFRSLT